MRTFMQYLITFCIRPEAAGDIISGAHVGPVLLNKPVKFPEAVGGSIFDCFSCRPYNFRSEIDNDVVSGMGIDNVGKIW